MTLDLTVSTFGTRESRLGSITGYNGDLQDLVSQSKCGTLRVGAFFTSYFSLLQSE